MSTTMTRTPDHTATTSSKATPTRLIALVTGLLLTLGIIAMPASAQAATARPAAAISYNAASSGARPAGALTFGTPKMSWTDCRNAARGPNAYVKVFNALTSLGCASTVIGAVGSVSAGHICWGSQQWWGAPYRWVVGMITWWQYDRC